jgi:hypothetical protein
MWQIIYRREKNTDVADYLLKRKPLLLEKTFPRSPAQGCIVCT